MNDHTIFYRKGTTNIQPVLYFQVINLFLVFVVIKVSLFLKEQGTDVASGGGLQKCPEQAERQMPEESKRNQRHQDKVREFAIDGDT